MRIHHAEVCLWELSVPTKPVAFQFDCGSKFSFTGIGISVVKEDR